MAKHLKLERYCWFDAQIRARLYPNVSSLDHRFEICRKTSQRTINYMRGRLRAPLKYDQNHLEYYYNESSFNLPHLPIIQNELLANLLDWRFVFAHQIEILPPYLFLSETC